MLWSRTGNKLSKQMMRSSLTQIEYIPRNMHTVTALLCFVVVIRWLIFPYPPGLLHWHCGNLTIAPVPAKQPWWIWINTSCEFIMNDCITTTKQSTTKPCAYFLGYTVCQLIIVSCLFGYTLDYKVTDLGWNGMRTRWLCDPEYNCSCSDSCFNILNKLLNSSR